MSKFLTCKYCGTQYDPEKGACPICGGSEALTEPESPAQCSDRSVPDQTPTPAAMDETRQFRLSDLPPVNPIKNEASQEEHESPADENPDYISDPFLQDETQTPQDFDLECMIQTDDADAPVPAEQPVSDQPAPDSQEPMEPDVPSAKEQSKKEKKEKKAKAKEEKKEKKKEKKKGPKGPVPTRDKVICLILASLVVLGGLYILYRFIRPYIGNMPTEATETTVVTEADLSCNSLVVDKTLSFTQIGQTHTLTVSVEPVETSDSVSFESDHPEIASVSSHGVVTAEGQGVANITVSCGNVMAVCTVTCDLEPAKTEPAETKPAETKPAETEPAETKAPDGPESLEMDRTDITFFKKGEVTRLKVGQWTEQAQWSSDDESVATVNGGKVTAVGSGTTRVHAKLGNAEAECIVRCSFKDSNPEEKPTEAPSSGNAVISKTDVTIAKGETFTLTLKDSSKETLDVSWSVSNSDVCSVQGNRVEGLSSGTATVSCTYDGNTYSCIVRVR